MATFWFSLCVIMSLGLLVLSLQGSPLHATDTLTMNHPLSGNQKLVSQGGNFALGFFQPAAEGSSGRWYIGMWYNKIPVQTVVWVANRDKPINDPASSTLAMSDDGNVVIYLSNSTTPVWSTNIANNTSTSSTVAVLLDTGNFVVTHKSNTTGQPLWQSFDHFSDTWLPGNKLSRNKITGLIKKMIAWKEHDDPATGVFSVQLDPGGSDQYIIFWNNLAQYWTSGNWTGNGFTGVPELSSAGSYQSHYTFQFVDNDQEAYFTYTVNNDALMFTRCTIDVSGQLQSWVWVDAAKSWQLTFSVPTAKCNIYGACGAYSKCSENTASPCACLKGFSGSPRNSWNLGDKTNGCRRNVPLQCESNSSGKTSQDRFYMISGVKLPERAQCTDAANVHNCESACLNNCSCTAYNFNGTCLLWHDGIVNLQDDVDGLRDSISIRLAASELPNSRTEKHYSIIGAIIAGIVVLGVGVATLHYQRRRRRINRINRGDESLINFKYSDLQFITRNFTKTLGTGSFGSVFEGILPDAATVAVKRLEGVRQGEKEFRAEVSTIGNIHHINLIRLLGFCSKGSKRLLVYEYMPNSSLDHHLFGRSPLILSWGTRYQIALGIAKGLAYLHEECRDCIIHCDIKPENILLDASFVPKIADFGLAKLLGRDFSRVLTSMRGTIGYLAPDWLSGQAITSKADVFSYGMMLFEIISGKRNVKHGAASGDAFFPLLVAEELPKGKVQILLDPKLAGEANLEEIERLCKVACWCIHNDPICRPTMREIIQILEGLVHVEMPPVPRYLQVLADDED